MDLLIIKKKKDAVIDNQIGEIFRQYNIFEFKSPRDGWTIDELFHEEKQEAIDDTLIAVVNNLITGAYLSATAKSNFQPETFPSSIFMTFIPLKLTSPPTLRAVCCDDKHHSKPSLCMSCSLSKNWK